jgi:hypothetical protein
VILPMRPVGFRLLLAAAAGVALSLTGRTSLADPPDSETAEKAFRQGRASAEAGDYPRAYTAFTESLRLDSAPGTLLNLADCEEHLGRFASAWVHFLRVESILPVTDERREVAHERAAQVAIRVPWVIITLTSEAPHDTRVFRDDVEMDGPRLAVPLPMDPGPHGVMVVAPGYEPSSTTVIAVEHETVRVVVSPGPAVRRETSRPSTTPAAVWLAGAAGIASLGVGTYFGARALAERSMSDASCRGGVCSSGLAVAEYASARGDARACDVALGVGIVALAVGGYLLLTSGREARAGTALRVTGAGLGGSW